MGRLAETALAVAGTVTILETIIKVLMAKNYVDNLSEEVIERTSQKAAQGHWPTVAHVGYVNNRETHRIDVDPVRGPLVAKVFELYATGTGHGR